jgi:hypothetical protein
MAPRTLAPSLLALAALAALAGCTEASQTLPATGLRLTPGALDFGEVPVGTTERRDVALFNGGEAAVEIQEITLGEPADPAFGFAFSRTRIPAGASATLTVDFTPTQAAPAHAVWRLGVGGGLGPILELRGEGVVPESPVGLCDGQDLLQFGQVHVGGSRTLPLEVCNSSDVDALVAVSGELGADGCGPSNTHHFCFSTPTGAEGPLAVPAGGRARLDVHFIPLLAGTRERATLALRGCPSAACRSTVRLEGFGIEAALACAPNLVSFGETRPGRCVDRNVTCQNATGRALTVRGWSAEAPFVAERTRRVALSVDEVLTLGVSYCPTDAPERDGLLTLTTDLAPPGDTVQVALTGRVDGGQLEVLPAGGLDFGPVALTGPRTRTLQLDSVGFGPVTITGLSIEDDPSGAFSVVDAAPGVLEPGARRTVTLRFAPTAPGPARAMLVIHSSLADEPERRVVLSGLGLDLPACTAEVSPLVLDFGDVLAFRSLTRDVVVRNRGPTDCLLYGAAPGPGADPAFEVSGAPSDAVRLGPEEAYVVSVTFRPTASRDHQGELRLELSTGQPAVTRAMSGRGLQESLLVAPNRVELGHRRSGCNASSTAVRVYNPTSETFTPTAMTVRADSDPGIQAQLPPGLVIPAHGDVTLDLTSQPLAPGPIQATVELSGLLGSTPLTLLVAVSGTADNRGWVEERVVQLGNRKLDLLLVLDFSSSTEGDRVILADGIHVLLELLDQLDLDYQLGVTTSDVDDEAGRLVHPATPDGPNPFSGPFSQRLITRDDPGGPVARVHLFSRARIATGGGAADEAGLYATHLALTPALLGGDNAGLVRPDAALSVLYLTDEPEQSVLSIGAPSERVSYYADMLRALKGFDGNRVSAAAIGGACLGPPGGESTITRLAELSAALGGASTAQCGTSGDGWVAPVAQALAQLRQTFFLRTDAVPSSITVSVGGRPVAPGVSGWTYDGPARRVTLSPLVLPAPGEEVVLGYATACP